MGKVKVEHPFLKSVEALPTRNLIRVEFHGIARYSSESAQKLLESLQKALESKGLKWSGIEWEGDMLAVEVRGNVPETREPLKKPTLRMKAEPLSPMIAAESASDARAAVQALGHAILPDEMQEPGRKTLLTEPEVKHLLGSVRLQKIGNPARSEKRSR